MQLFCNDFDCEFFSDFGYEFSAIVDDVDREIF